MAKASATIGLVASPCCLGERDGLLGEVKRDRGGQSAEWCGDSEVGQATDLEIGAFDPPCQRQSFLEVAAGVRQPQGPQLGGAERHQRQGTNIVGRAGRVGRL